MTGITKSAVTNRVSDSPAWLGQLRRSSKDRYYSSTGQAWIRFHRFAFMRFPPHVVSQVTRAEERELFRNTNAAFIAHHHLPDSDEKPNAILYLCRNKDYDVGQLSANNRSKVRRGMRRLTVRRAEPHEIREKGYPAYRDTCLRNSIRPVSEEAYRAKWVSDTGDDNREIWAAFAGEDVAAVATVWICGRWAELFSTQSANKYLKDYPNHALFFTVLRELLHREGIESVSYGLSSINDGAKRDSLHAFKLSVNLVPVPVVRVIRVNPLLRPLVNPVTIRLGAVLESWIPGSRHLKAANGALRHLHATGGYDPV